MRIHSAAPLVRIAAPARLHLGFIDQHGGLGRRFGSLGLAIDGIETVVAMARADRIETRGFERERAAAALRLFAEAFDVSVRHRVDVERAIPSHAGLGSGTQIAMAIGAGLARLEGQDVSLEKIGALAARGRRTSAGMAAFATGGFVLDGGRGGDGRAPPILARHDFPKDWRIVLALDPRAKGLHGDAEKNAFAALPPFPEALAGHLSRLVLMRVLPGLVERDIGAFGAGIAEIQAVAGDHFAPAQGGSRWTSTAVGAIVEKLGTLGATGIGQSSWGPTGFAFVESEAQARSLVDRLAGEAAASGLTLQIVSGRNRGADIETRTLAESSTETESELT